MQTLTFEIKGLWTNASDVAGTPKGSLAVALNLDLSKPNVAQYRRGFDLLQYDLPNPTDRATKLFVYDSKLFATYNDFLGLYDENTGWASKGALIKPANALVARTVSINENLYISSSTGLKKLDDVANSIYQAGMPSALNMDLTLSVSTGTAVFNTKSVAYRFIVARTDANNAMVLGGVSSRAVITNASGADKDVTVKGYLPTGLDNSYLVQVSRSANFTGDPDDNLQLCYELPLTNTDISNGYFTFVDINPDALLGTYLYTSPAAGLGLTTNNDEPPLAADIAEYKGCLFFADTVSKHRFTLTLIACGGSGLIVNDTFTISDGTTTEVYTAKASTLAASKFFAVDTASASLSVRIDSTIRQLLSVINQKSTLVYATLLSTGASSLPGKIILQSRALGGAAFTVLSSRATPWSPQLQPTAGTSQTSKNDAFRNGLMFSKFGLPEAVPTANSFRIGSSDDPIKRIIPLRDGLLIFKGADGTWILTGEDSTSFSATLLDGTAKLTAPESLVVLNGYVYGLFENGICQVSDTNVDIISAQIWDKVQRLYGICYSEVVSKAFGIASEIDGHYILALPQNAGDTYSTYQLVYNVFNSTYCEWDLAISAGVVSSVDKKIYVAAGNSNRVRKEFKTFSAEDLADYEQNCTLLTPSGFTLSITGTEFMDPGDALVQTDLVPAYILSVDVSAGTVEVDVDQEWDTLIEVQHFKGINAVVTWNSEFAGNPAGLKHFSECSLVFKQSLVQGATLSFSSDTNPALAPVPLIGPDSNAGFGSGGFGEGSFGGEAVPQPIRKGVPRSSARCNNLSVSFSTRVAFSDWQLEGISLVFTPTSTRTSR